MLNDTAQKPVTLNELVREHGGYVMSCLRYWMPGDPAAKDVYQEVWLAVTRSFHTFRGDCKPRTWLFTITLRAMILARKHQRSRGFARIASSRQSNLLPSPYASVPLGSPSHEARALRAPIASLDELDRELLFLRALEDLTWDEIAHVMTERAAATGTLRERAVSLAPEALKKRYSRLCKTLRLEISAC
jgi:RNA polymerase sigma-70 factor (ECF subfamily)